MSEKPSNPKDMLGSDKLPLHLWPKIASAYGCLGLLDGMLKYGRSNWRVAGVRASIYADALERHMGYWFEGQDTDPDSGLPHLAHALACIAILIDAQSSGQLTDDRQYPGGHVNTMAALTPHVKRLKARITQKDPKHYTIQDRSTRHVYDATRHADDGAARIGEVGPSARLPDSIDWIALTHDAFAKARAKGQVDFELDADNPNYWGV